MNEYVVILYHVHKRSELVYHTVVWQV